MWTIKTRGLAAAGLASVVLASGAWAGSSVKGGSVQAGRITADPIAPVAGGSGISAGSERALPAGGSNRLRRPGSGSPQGSGAGAASGLGGTADFSGFAQGAAVGNAYAGLGFTFTGANVLNSFNGGGNPDAGIVHSPGGRIVIGINGFTPGPVEFRYATRTTLTVSSHVSTDGSGPATGSWSVAANNFGNGYFVWSSFLQVVRPDTRSLVISGAADSWGLDRLTITGCPAPASAADDCNGNGISDACEIAAGVVQDCDGNGKPDACDIAGTPPVPGAVQWRVEDGGNGHCYAVIRTGGAISWHSSRDQAAGVGGSLVSITTFAEQEFVRALISGPENWGTDNGTSPGQWGPWIGAFQPDPQSPAAAGWNWVTGEPWTFEGWQPGEPNDAGWGGARESFAHFSRGAGNQFGWNDFTAEGHYAVRAFVAEWSGGDSDCNANGIPDSCDLANGTSLDRNGNGIPDECDPNPVLALTSNAVACNAVGSTVTVEARLSGVVQTVVSGQMLIDWDPSTMSLAAVNPGDAPFNVVYSLNQAAGQVSVLASVAPGNPGESVSNKAMARLVFTVIGGSCDGSGTEVGFFSAGPLQTAFTDGLGNAIIPALTGSAGFVVDDGNPVFTNVPADVVTRPEAGDGAFAMVSLTAPTATDSCSPLTQTATRSDGQPLSAAYPVGVTTVTWRAVDPCGNEAVDVTRVTVEPYNTMSFTVSYAGSGFAANMTRNLSLSVLGAGGAQARTPSAAFAAGTATFEVTDLPVDSYSCTTVEDTARSLRRRVNVTDGGATWTATASLVLGDIINDEVIDVLDWGAYVVFNANADLNGDGVINAADGQFILDNFGVQGDGGCGSGLNGPPSPRESVSVAELVQMGLAELAGADLNGDGWLDLRDMDLVD